MKFDFRKFFWLAPVLIAGVAARFWCGTLGQNYDFDSYRIVADLTAAGKNVYASTDRYNYGPVWFHLIHLLDVLGGHDPQVFRRLLIGVLSAADAGVFFVLLRQFGARAAVLFFLNPVSIMITGHHNQFDNLAILLGLCAVWCFGEEFEKPLGRRQFLALSLLGLSLMTKHLLFVFPLWLAVKQRGLLSKFFVLAVPPAIFLAGFLPYWSAAHGGIVQNVFEYKSTPGLTGYNEFFYNEFVPHVLQSLAGAQFYWLLALAAGAFACRRRGALDSLLVYTGVLVAAAPAMANQYLAIPVAFISTAINPVNLAYTIFATLHIAAYPTGPQLIKNSHARFDDIAAIFLVLAVAWKLWHKPLAAFVFACRHEIRRQFGLEE